MPDRINTKEYWDMLWKSPKRHVERYSMQWVLWRIMEFEPKSVLDIGCGNGLLLFRIKQLLPACEVFGVDLSETAIARMRNQYGLEGQVMDAYDVDQLPRTFDFIVANHLLEHLYRDREFVKKCQVLLNPGGMFYAAVPNNISGPEETEEHVRKYDNFSLKALLSGVFGNANTTLVGKHLIGWSQKV